MKRTEVSNIERILLIIAVPLMFAGTYILYDFPQALEKVLIDKFKVTAVSVVSLYSISSCSTLVMDVAMIWILKKISLGQSAVLFQAMFVLGVLFTHLGTWSTSFSYVIFGRLILGIGMECLYVINNIATEKWFTGSEMIIVCGLARIIIRICTSMDAFLLPVIFVKSGSLNPVMVFIEVVALATFGMTVIFYLIDRKHGEKERDGSGSTNETDNSVEIELQDLSIEHEEDLEEARSPQIKVKNHQDLSDYESEEKQRKSFTTQKEVTKNKSENVSNQSKADEQEEAIFEVKHLKHVPLVTWALIASATFSVCCYFQFTNIATDLITVRYNYAYLDAKNAAAIISFLNMFLMTAAIFVSSKFGKRTYIYLIGSIGYLVSYLSLITLSSQTPPAWKVDLSLSALSAGNGLIVSSTMPGILFTIPTKSSHYVVPIMAIFYNLPAMVCSPIFGYISKARTPAAYQNCLYLLLVFSWIGVGLSLLIFYLNRRGDINGLLDLSGNHPYVVEYKKMINQKVDNLILGKKTEKTKAFKKDIGDAYALN